MRNILATSVLNVVFETLIVTGVGCIMKVDKMNTSVNVVTAIRKLAELFRQRSSDTTTLDQIVAYTHDRSRWQKAHDLFDVIRFKTLKASKSGDATMEAQYQFEEACAKTLYNLGRFSAPFDPDSPYWIIPRALCAAKHLGIDQQSVIDSLEAGPGGAQITGRV